MPKARRNSIAGMTEIFRSAGASKMDEFRERENDRREERRKEKHFTHFQIISRMHLQILDHYTKIRHMIIMAYDQSC
jgi:hypothetical protein